MLSGRGEVGGVTLQQLVFICLLLVAVQANGVIGVREDQGDSSSPSLSNNRSKRMNVDDLYERPEIGFFNDGDERDRVGKEAEDLARPKKSLAKDGSTNRVSMLFHDLDRQINEKIEDAVNFTTTDFIIRLQEKYEDIACDKMLEAMNPETYFYYDSQLVFPEAETPANRPSFFKKIADTEPGRYRMLGEPCNKTNEWKFWHAMFLVAENDHEPADLTSGSNSSTLIAVPLKEMMQRFNRVWKDYQKMGVCNQRLLLECFELLDTETGEYLEGCGCRNSVVGLSSIFDVRRIPKSPFLETYTTQYYDDNTKLVADKSVRDEEKPFRFAFRCALVAQLPYVGVDINIINPCDFFLPMIGMCRADCVENSSCISVPLEMKEKTQQKSIKDRITRVKEQRIHDKFHNRCVCKPGMHCRYLGDAVYGVGQRLGGLSPVGMILLQLGLGLMSYSITHAIF